jgi:hypothetical protein
MPVIDRGDDYFQAGTYTGNGSTQTITGLRFQPDFVWIKGRSGATDHALYDAVRGVQKQLESNQTGAESTETTGLTAFTSDGFTVGSLAQVNTNAATYAYWAWKANGSGVSNTDGSITSTVSVNSTSGFSIVTYTGNSTNGATVGHGLGVVPSMVIVKCRTLAESWHCYHVSLGNAQKILLNSTAAVSATSVWNSTTPTSSVVTFNDDTAVNDSGQTYVAYCFAPVAGYSAFGSYTGNGSADGPFVYTGFRPRYVMIKIATGDTGQWVIYDTARDTYNAMDLELQAESSNAENQLGSNPIDCLSNGFKIRSTTLRINRSTSTFIYMAFAENPFAYSLAR